MLRVGIIGATGYTGEKIVEILLNRPEIRITYVSAKVEKKQNLTDIFPRFVGKINLSCDNLNLNKAVDLCDLLFLAVPHKVSMEITPALLKENKTVIDLSADYRIKNEDTYKIWYGTSHKDKRNLKDSVYGLPELYREKIKKAKLIANPGCYPTAAILALAPLVVSGMADYNSIIIDAKSGLTGAGRKAVMDLFFSEINENLKAYKINSHQHMPEINQILSGLADKKISVNFIPHMIPMNRGIIETIYVKIKPQTNEKNMHKLYQRFYKTEPFVRINDLGKFPEIKDVIATNFCDIGIKYSKEQKLLIIVVAIDNLMKGAASQAVQNMNIVCGFKEEEGLL